MTRKVDTAADLDEQTLTKIAEMTGGQYFRARDAEQLERSTTQSTNWNLYQAIPKLGGLSPNGSHIH